MSNKRKKQMNKAAKTPYLFRFLYIISGRPFRFNACEARKGHSESTSFLCFSRTAMHPFFKLFIGIECEKRRCATMLLSRASTAIGRYPKRKNLMPIIRKAHLLNPAENLNGLILKNRKAQLISAQDHAPARDK